MREPGPQSWGSLETETVIYGLVSRGIQTRERLRWRDPTATVNYNPVLSSEMTPHNKSPSCLLTISLEVKLKFVAGP
jgi:hypothetical protein